MAEARRPDRAVRGISRASAPGDRLLPNDPHDAAAHVSVTSLVCERVPGGTKARSVTCSNARAGGTPPGGSRGTCSQLPKTSRRSLALAPRGGMAPENIGRDHFRVRPCRIQSQVRAPLRMGGSRRHKQWKCSPCGSDAVVETGHAPCGAGERGRPPSSRHWGRPGGSSSTASTPHRHQRPRHPALVAEPSGPWLACAVSH